MPFIHEAPDWPRFSWRDSELAAELASVRHAQGLLLGRMEALGFEHRSEANLRTLTAELVKSWAIEGETLDAAEVRSSLAGQLGLDAGGLPRASRATDGAAEMMLDATRNHAAPVSEERLFSWHAALFPTGHAGISKITVGAWRTDESGPMRVLSGRIGRETVHYEAPPAERVGGEMRRLLEWFDGEHAHDPVLAAGVGHLWFLTVHPFDDGNGRIARALTDLALSRADRTDARFYSLSAQIEQERAAYYDQLEAAQRGSLDITGWLLWFLGCLGRSVQSAETTLHSVLRKARVWQRLADTPFNERQRKVLNRLLDGFEGALTNAKYARIAKCSADTALRDIRQLLESGALERNAGGGRSTSYRLAADEDPPS